MKKMIMGDMTVATYHIRPDGRSVKLRQWIVPAPCPHSWRCWIRHPWQRVKVTIR